MAQVWERTELSQSETLVALALADHADDDGECWPSIDRIAEKARLKRRATQNVIQRLEILGLIVVERAVGRRNTNTYRFHVEQKGAPDAPFKEPEKGASRYRQKVHPGTEKVHLDDIKGAPATAPEPSVTIIEPPEEEPPGLDMAAWRRFLEYRKKKKKPVRPESVASAKRMLAMFGVDQAAVVEQTIAMGWQGLFALKTNGRATNGFKPSRPAADLVAEAEARGENIWALPGDDDYDPSRASDPVAARLEHEKIQQRRRSRH